MKRFILIASLMIWAMAAAAQNAAVEGTLADPSTKEPIPFANVVLMGVDDTLFLKGCSTDENGHFAFKNFPKGRYQIKISSVGYQTFDTLINILSVTHLNQLSLRQGVTLKEVKIMATKPLFSTDGEKNIYNTTDDPSVQTGTAVDALQNAPGIEVDADGNITLRGVQEVSIWINNRESKMNQEALKQYLKSLPANAIQRIEVITNPSARYGGSRPVVNIIMEHQGLRNQFVSLGANANTRPEIDPWISYIFNNDKWEADIYASLGYTHNITTTAGESNLMAGRNDTSCSEIINSSLDETAIAPIISVDLAYHPDSLNTIALWLGAFPQWSGQNASTLCQRKEYIYSPGDYSYSEQRTKDLSDPPSASLFDGIWLEHIFDNNSGHSLSGGYFGGLWSSDSLLRITRNYPNSNRSEWMQKELNANKEWIHGVEMNYVLPWGRQDSATGLFANELEAGMEGEFTHRTMRTRVDTMTADGNYQNCVWLSHASERKALNGDIYAMLTHRWGALSVKGGVRSSITSGSMYYPEAQGYNYQKTRCTWNPSIHLAYTTPSEQTFSLGYTYRSSMPGINDYTQYRTLRIDDYSIGNPLLGIGTLQILEAKWNKYFDKFGTIEVNAYHIAKTNTQGEITDVIYDSLYYRRIVSFAHPINIGNASNSGVDLNVGYRPSAFINVRFNTSLFYSYQNIQFRAEEAPLESGMLCYSFRLNAWVKLWDKLQLFSNIYYKSPTQNILNTQLAHKGVDVGLNAELWNHALSINLNVNDLFNWNDWSSVSNNPYFGGEKETKNLSRYISLGITLRLGEMGLEHAPKRAKRHPSIGAEDTVQ